MAVKLDLIPQAQTLACGELVVRARRWLSRMVSGRKQLRVAGLGFWDLAPQLRS